MIKPIALCLILSVSPVLAAEPGEGRNPGSTMAEPLGTLPADTIYIRAGSDLFLKLNEESQVPVYIDEESEVVAEGRVEPIEPREPVIVIGNLGK